jgi:tol-pal system beta propeller repeat protein TolB
VVLCLFGMSAPVAHATFPGGNGKIVFASNERLFTIDPDGTDLTLIPNPLCEGLEPDWAPNAQTIGFIHRCGPSSTFDISAINADGSGLTDLFASNTDDARIDWSRDGSRFLFISDMRGNREIYVKNLVNGQVTNVSNNPATDDWPAWSPHGNRIAFVSNRGGNFEVYTMKANGTGVRNLTNHPADDGNLSLGGPSWSPDGRKIAFDSYRTGSPEVFSMNSCGRNVTQLTNGGINQQPAWSPNGRLIAFTSDRTGNRDLFLMTSDGEAESPLGSPNFAFDERPDWQVLSGPDGEDGDDEWDDDDHGRAKRGCGQSRG